MTSGTNDDFPVTRKGLAAADEVLKGWPEFTGEARERAREVLAKEYARLGATNFKLFFNLRVPRSWRESLRLERLTGKISAEEFNDRLRTSMVRPVDKEMLDTLLAESEYRVRRYGRFLTGIARIAAGERHPSEVSLGSHALSMRRKMAISPAEIGTACAFLRLVRASKPAETVQIKDYLESTAIDLSLAVTRDAWHYWNRAYSGVGEMRLPAVLPVPMAVVQYFWEHCFELLPSARAVSALLRSEHAMGIAELERRRSRNGGIPESAQIIVSGEHVHITREATAGLATEKPLAGRAEPRLKVSDWSDLALGIDEKRRVWAITPPPAKGAIFTKGDAIAVPVRKGDGLTLLETLADSSTGQSADIYAVASKLGLMPPSSSLQPDGRARPDSLRRGQTDEINLRGEPWRKKLNDVLSDVGRRLRRVVLGPVGKGDSAFSMGGKTVNCGFVVRHLHRDEGGHLRFGIKPS